MALTQQQADYLDAIGITRWRARESTQGDVVTEVASEVPVLDASAKSTLQTSLSNWEHLQAKAMNCQACGLHKTRKHVVFGVGDPSADLVIVGEAPGAQEDKQGEPFVGRAGKLLDAMLAAIDCQRESIYIANILKCRPPGNRDPEPDEIERCTPFLVEQLRIINPKVIFAVGRFAAHYLLNTTLPMGKLRSRVHHSELLNKPVIVSYHPAYLLRSPSEKAKAFADLQMVQRELSGLSD